MRILTLADEQFIFFTIGLFVRFERLFSIVKNVRIVQINTLGLFYLLLQLRNLLNIDQTKLQT